jgi:hypothetical protein
MSTAAQLSAESKGSLAGVQAESTVQQQQIDALQLTS